MPSIGVGGWAKGTEIVSIAQLRHQCGRYHDSGSIKYWCIEPGNKQLGIFRKEISYALGVRSELGPAEMDDEIISNRGINFALAERLR
jgi:hypothetical protein